MNFSIPLKQELLEVEPSFLEEFGLRVVAHHYDAKRIGGSVVVLESAAMRLRLVRDRLSVYGEVAPCVRAWEWWELTLVLETIQGERPHAGRELGDVIRLLRKNRTAVEQALGPGWLTTRQDLKRRLERRTAESFIPRRMSLKSLPRSAGWRGYLPFLGLGAAIATTVFAARCGR